MPLIWRKNYLLDPFLELRKLVFSAVKKKKVISKAKRKERFTTIFILKINSSIIYMFVLSSSGVY